VVDGNQNSYDGLSDDVLAERLPIRTEPRWGAPTGTGLGIRVDERKVRKYRTCSRSTGSICPTDRTSWRARSELTDADRGRRGPVPGRD
jgi:hypothetical protein